MVFRAGWEWVGVHGTAEIVGPDEPVVYPEHLTEELDYELELAVVLKKSGKWFPPEEADDYIGGYVIFNDITARDIQRREMRSGVFSFCKAIDTFCPLGPWIVTPDEIPDPHDLAMELRVNGDMESRIGNNLSLSVALENCDALVSSLTDIAVSSTSACSSGSAMPSHVLQAIGAEGASTLRVTVAPAPTMQNSPRVMPARMTAPAPREASARSTARFPFAFTA